jgi:hypothetical protein
MIISAIEKIEALPVPPLGFLPALHDATLTTFAGTTLVTGTAVASTLPSADQHANQVFLVTDADITAPSYESWPAQTIAKTTHVGSDGRFWYPVVPYGTTNTYYPKAFERTLYTIAFTPASLPLRLRWELLREYSFRLFNNNTDVVWNIVWEFGDRIAETSPAPVGPNIKAYSWRRPLLDEQIPITDVLSKNVFGISLRKIEYTQAGAPVYESTIERYGRRLAASSAQLPLTENFVLRLRLSCFDTLDNVASPRGYVAYLVDVVKAKE